MRKSRRVGRRGGSFLQWLAFTYSALATVVAAPVPSSCWDAASEFNDSLNSQRANPCGVWSYGWKKTVTDQFFPASNSYNDPPNRSVWCSASGSPSIFHNSRLISVNLGLTTSIIPPHSLCLEPGLTGEYAVIRFTAPVDGAFLLSGQFFALTETGAGTTTDVWILPNDNKTGAFMAEIDCRRGLRSASFTGKLFELKKGNTLDFEVGYGTDKSYDNDTTGLVLLIEKVR